MRRAQSVAVAGLNLTRTVFRANLRVPAVADAQTDRPKAGAPPAAVLLARVAQLILIIQNGPQSSGGTMAQGAFEISETVVHPRHGIAVIEGRYIRKFEGQELEYLRIRVP